MTSLPAALHRLTAAASVAAIAMTTIVMATPASAATPATITATRLDPQCSTTLKASFRFATASGPLAGVFIETYSRTASGTKTGATSIRTDANGVATASYPRGATTGPIYASTGTGLYTVSTPASLSRQFDAGCTLSGTVTTAPPSVVGAGETATVSGTVDFRDATGALVPGTGYVYAMWKPLNGVENVLKSIPVAADGSWSSTVAVSAAGTMRFQASTSLGAYAVRTVNLGSTYDISTTPHNGVLTLSTVQDTTAGVSVNRPITLTGTISATSSATGSPIPAPALSGTKVAISFTPAGSSTPEAVGTAVVNSTGTYMLASNVKSNGTYTAAVSSSGVVAAPVSWTLSNAIVYSHLQTPPSASTASDVTFKATVSPGSAGVDYPLEVLLPGATEWTPAGTVQAGANDKLAPPVAGSYAYRICPPATVLAGSGCGDDSVINVVDGATLLTPNTLNCRSVDSTAPVCTWSAIRGVDGYSVYKDGVKVATTTGASATTATLSQGIVVGELATTTLTATLSGVETRPSLEDKTVRLAPLTGLVQQPAAAGSATLSWAPVTGADGYYVSVNGGRGSAVTDTAVTLSNVVPGDQVSVYGISRYSDTSASATLTLSVMLTPAPPVVEPPVVTPPSTDPGDGVTVDNPLPAMCLNSIVKLANGGFEDPFVKDGTWKYIDESKVPGWQTSATDNKIEIWGNGFNKVTAEEGRQFAEINATQNAELYQVVDTIPGSTLVWSLLHRARAGGAKGDVMRVNIGANGQTPDSVTTVKTVLADGWVRYTGKYEVPEGQTRTRFGFEAVSTAGGSKSIGNFLDDIYFNDCTQPTAPAPAPQPPVVEPVAPVTPVVAPPAAQVLNPCTSAPGPNPNSCLTYTPTVCTGWSVDYKRYATTHCNDASAYVGAGRPYTLDMCKGTEEWQVVGINDVKKRQRFVCTLPTASLSSR